MLNPLYGKAESPQKIHLNSIYIFVLLDLYYPSILYSKSICFDCLTGFLPNKIQVLISNQHTAGSPQKDAGLWKQLIVSEGNLPSHSYISLPNAVTIFHLAVYSSTVHLFSVRVFGTQGGLYVILNSFH